MGTRAQRGRAAGWRAVTAGAVAAAAAVGTTAVAGCSSAGGSSDGGSPGSRVAFAPYADTSVTPAYDMAGTLRRTSVKAFTLGFVTAAGGSACEPRWGGTTPLGADPVAAGIKGVRAAGGDVRVSFGGQSGTELARACSSEAALARAYGSVVDTYRLTRVDFDVEGDAVGDAAADTRRAEAIAQLQKEHPGLDVSLTLPVETDGLRDDAVALVKNAAGHGVHIGTINIMTMDYGEEQDGDMETYAEQAANAAHRQLRSALGLGDRAAWKALAVTPMIGVNDVASETFTADDAHRLVDFARARGLGGLAFWSGNRDRACPGGPHGRAEPTCSSVDQEPLAFTRAFAAAAA